MTTIKLHDEISKIEILLKNSNPFRTEKETQDLQNRISYLKGCNNMISEFEKECKKYPQYFKF